MWKLVLELLEKPPRRQALSRYPARAPAPCAPAAASAPSFSLFFFLFLSLLLLLLLPQLVLVVVETLLLKQHCLFRRQLPRPHRHKSRAPTSCLNVLIFRVKGLYLLFTDCPTNGSVCSESSNVHTRRERAKRGEAARSEGGSPTAAVQQSGRKEVLERVLEDSSGHVQLALALPARSPWAEKRGRYLKNFGDNAQPIEDKETALEGTAEKIALERQDAPHQYDAAVRACGTPRRRGSASAGRRKRGERVDRHNVVSFY